MHIQRHHVVFDMARQQARLRHPPRTPLAVVRLHQPLDHVRVVVRLRRQVAELEAAVVGAAELEVDDAHLVADLDQVLRQQVVVARREVGALRGDGGLDPAHVVVVVAVAVRDADVLAVAQVEEALAVAEDVQLRHEGRAAVVQPPAGDAGAADALGLLQRRHAHDLAVEELQHERRHVRDRSRAPPARRPSPPRAPCSRSRRRARCRAAPPPPAGSAAARRSARRRRRWRGTSRG